MRKILSFVLLSLLFIKPSFAEETCKDNTACKEGEYCKKEVGACDAMGVCVDKPEMCTMDYSPVCDCSGKTRPNSCSAASKGESLKSLGACVKE